MTINFYNNYNNGDVHFSRTLIRLIKESYPDSKFNYLHKNKKGILEDLDFIEEMDLDYRCIENESVSFYDDIVYINTWYGQSDFYFLKKNGGCTLKTVNDIVHNIFSKLNKKINFNEEILYPSVDFSKINKPKINDGFNILICNNNSLSGQSNNINLDSMIDNLSELFPNITFYVTDKNNINKKNVIFTSDITNSSPDLLEISYLSTKCNIIVGRSSGPYSFSMIYENIKDNTKVFFGLCHEYIVGIWNTDYLNCKYYHNPGNDINEITNNLAEIINNYGK
jgi:hypothetical protein